MTVKELCEANKKWNNETEITIRMPKSGIKWKGKIENAKDKFLYDLPVLCFIETCITIKEVINTLVRDYD